MSLTSPDRVYDQILGIETVVARCGISKATVYRLMKTDDFPRAFRLTPSGRRVGWRASEVDAWAAEPLAWGARRHF